MAERQILQDAISIGLVHDGHLAKASPAFRVLGGEQVALAGVRTQHFATGGDFETFGDRLLGFNAFGATHKSSTFSKRARNIETGAKGSKRYFRQGRPKF